MAKSFLLPGQPTRYGRDHPFIITHMKLEIEPDFQEKTISGKVTYKITPAGTSISFVELDSADLEIRSVLVEGEAANFEIMPKSIKVLLRTELQFGQNSKIEIEYSAAPKRGLYFRGPTEKFPDRVPHLFTQGEPEDSKHWFPCFDYPNMRYAWEIIVRSPLKMTVVSNGRLVSVRDSGDKKVWEFSQEIPAPSYLVSLVVGEYESVSLAYQGISLEYYVPANRRDDITRSFEKTPKMLDFFASATGQKYPYPKYAQTVVSDFMVGGMENISATTLTETTLHDERGHLDFQSDNLVSHELAHQWFGDYITCRDWSHAWLNEGFATYFNVLFREKNEGEDDFQYSMHLNQERIDEEIQDFYQRQIVEKRYWHSDELFDAHTYEKGSWVLHGLRGLVGEDLFWKGIRRYVESCKVSLVETADFRNVLEESSGLVLEKFFEEWLYSPGYPEYDATFSFDENSMTAKLTLEQINAHQDGVPLFSTPIQLDFTFKDGTKKSSTITMGQKKSFFSFSLSSRPLNVSLDPRNWILKKLRFHKPKEMFLHQLRHDENAMERVRAAEALGNEFRTEDVIEELSASIDSDKFWGVRLEAAKFLGKLGTRRALDFLLSKKDHKDHKVRRGVAMGLRYFAELESGRAEALETLIEYTRSDYSYYVRAFAAESIGFFKKSERAREALKAAILQDSVNDQVRYRAFLGFAELKSPEVIPLAAEYLKNGLYSWGKIGAVEAVAKAGKGRPEALELLLSLKTDPDPRIKEAAAGSISDLEDQGVVPDLKEWLSSEEDGRTARRLRETIFDLEQKVKQTEKIAQLEEDVRRITEESNKLKSEVAEMKAKLENRG
ncbi:MAG: M1 family aminopeptidase [Thaumarchaeota archaeon]|nr:M1 family aminopeptidase [Nitrososphaerota archaeon]